MPTKVSEGPKISRKEVWLNANCSTCGKFKQSRRVSRKAIEEAKLTAVRHCLQCGTETDNTFEVGQAYDFS
mgnify:CR=1 FL=1